jgi:hypothetical protein
MSRVETTLSKQSNIIKNISQSPAYIANYTPWHLHIFEIAQKSPQQLEVNMTMSTIITV